MDSSKYLEKIRAEDMSREQLIRQIRVIYEDYASASKECDTLNQMLAQVKIDKTSYEKEFAREVIVRKYANSDIYGFNIYSDRHDIEQEDLYFSEVNYLPVDYDRMIAEVEADYELMPLHTKIMAKIAIWFDDCVEYLRGIWGITN